MVAPLAWTLHHGAVITLSDVLHRWGCQELEGLARIVKPGETLWREWAPKPCSACRPDVALRFGARRG